MAFATNEVHAGSNPAGRSRIAFAVSTERSLVRRGGLLISPVGSDARKTAQVRILPDAP